MSGFLGYIKPRKILSDNAFVFINLGCNFVLTKGEFSVTVKMGLYSSVFVNHWIHLSGTPGVVPFEVGFDQSDPGSKTGQLCALSPALQNETQNLSPYDRDIVAVEVFCYSEVYFRTCSLDDLKTAYILPGFVRDGGFEEASLLGGAVFHASYDVGLLRLSGEWTQLIVARGWSWNLQNGIVYVSNSKSAAYGLPPNFEMLGLPRLELRFPQGSRASMPVARTAPRSPPSGGTWEVVIADFLATPTPKTLTAVLCSDRAQNDYLSMRSCPEYSPGTNRFKLTSALILKMSAYGQCATPADLAAALKEVTVNVCGDMLKAQFILLKKLNSQLKVNAGLGTLHFTK